MVKGREDPELADINSDDGVSSIEKNPNKALEGVDGGSFTNTGGQHTSSAHTATVAHGMSPEEKEKERAQTTAMQLGIILRDIKALECLLEEYKERIGEIGKEIFILDKTMTMNEATMAYYAAREGMSMSEIAANEFKNLPPEAVMAALNNPITHNGRLVNFGNEGLYYLIKDEDGNIIDDPDTGLPLREYITDTTVVAELMHQTVPQGDQPPKVFANLTFKGDPTNSHVHQWIGVDIKVPEALREDFEKSKENIDPALTIEPATADDAFKICNSAQECMMVKKDEMQSEASKTNEKIKDIKGKLSDKYEERNALEKEQNSDVNAGSGIRVDYDAIGRRQLSEDFKKHAAATTENTSTLLSGINIPAFFRETQNFFNAAFLLLKGNLVEFDLFMRAWLGKYYNFEQETDPVYDPTNAVDDATIQAEKDGTPLPPVHRPSFLTQEGSDKLANASARLNDHYTSATMHPEATSINDQPTDKINTEHTYAPSTTAGPTRTT